MRQARILLSERAEDLYEVVEEATAALEMVAEANGKANVSDEEIYRLLDLTAHWVGLIRGIATQGGTEGMSDEEFEALLARLPDAE